MPNSSDTACGTSGLFGRSVMNFWKAAIAAQHGAIAALETPASAIAEIRAELEANRDAAIRLISEKLPCRCPEGAFYLFPDVSGHLHGNRTAEDLAAKLLKDAGVAVVPGEAFGMQNHIRISYALPEKELIAGFERMAEVL